MSDSLPQQLSELDRGCVVAAAGCGKTHMIAEAVSKSNGRQLVLTHTHAGVRAMRDRFAQLGVSSKRYRVSTIDGMALKYASAFPTLSGCTERSPRGDAWDAIRPCASAVLSCQMIRRVLKQSYTGVFVDEYQDCSRSQHEFIKSIAAILPCRILGDPLQSLFLNINSTDSIKWKDVTTDFPVIGESVDPWRWRGRNEGLGDWLATVRVSLERGEPIDLSSAPVQWRDDVKQVSQIKACYNAVQDEATVSVIRQWGQQCHNTAKFLRDLYKSIEPVECEDLLLWSERIESSVGVARCEQVFEFVKECLVRRPPPVVNVLAGVAQSKTMKPRDPDASAIYELIQRVRDGNELQHVREVLVRISQISGIGYRRHELWHETIKTLVEHERRDADRLVDTAWLIRDSSRRLGRIVPSRCIGTPLLLKGLQFQHALILDEKELNTPESLYVALTRGSDNLTIFSTGRTLVRSVPDYMG